MNKPARFLVIIDAGGGMVARLFDADRRPVAEFDASSEEVGVMITGLQPQASATDAVWDHPLDGHSHAERQSADVYLLDV